jgi:hypothetical protein
MVRHRAMSPKEAKMHRMPSFSAVVEWENAKLSGAARATRMLRELADQTRELSGLIDKRPELILLYEKGEVEPAMIERALHEAFGAQAPLDVRCHATEGSNYYGQKNIGAELASRDYLLFLDSDVVPEPGWLRALLGSLGPGVDVVAGSTYVDPSSFFGRAFALFWFFPPRTVTAGLRESDHFFANNVLFRRDLFLAYRFPDLPLYRGHCSALGLRLRRDGVRLFIQSGARVAHPPPNPQHFVHRALSEGYDLAIRARIAGQEKEFGTEELRRQLGNMRQRVANRLQHLEVGKREIHAARMLATTYCLLRFAGQRWTARSPQRAQKMLGIRTFGMKPEGGGRLSQRAS